MMKYPEKLARGESIAIIQFQYDYNCNFDCEHCSIDKFYVPKAWEDASGRRKFELEDVRRLSKEADEMGLANFVITGGEPLILKEYDELVEAIDPSKFYLVTDSNGWFLDDEKAKHLKKIATLSLRNIPIKRHKVLLDFIVKNGYSEEYGARNIARFIKNEVAVTAADAILEGKVPSNGGRMYTPRISKSGKLELIRLTKAKEEL